MFKFKKFKKKIEREVKNRYDKLEKRYHDMEGGIYTVLDTRLSSLEQKFDELTDLLKQDRNKTEAAPETIAKKVEDDLTKIKGLGKKFAEKLNKEGINSFAELAALSTAEIEKIDANIKSFAARFVRYEWGLQAKNLK